MIVLRGWSTDHAQPATKPFPRRSGIFIELRGGDIVHPRGKGDWFKPPYFSRVVHAFVKWPILPFISWRIGNRGGYFGMKIYGLDSTAYKNWLPEHYIFGGSQAIMLSIRPFANLTGE